MEYLKRFQTQDLDFIGQVTGILSNAQGMTSVFTPLWYNSSIRLRYGYGISYQVGLQQQHFWGHADYVTHTSSSCRLRSSSL